jgi:2-polyprenyl-3-methyl-5-hydroxy-6-metoxy-1,4-benzoquinol methylase
MSEQKMNELDREIRNEIQRLRKEVLLDNKWDHHRNSYFEYLEVERINTHFGEKVALRIKDKQKYYDLQASRGIPFQDKDIDDFLRDIDNYGIRYAEQDDVRLRELLSLNFDKHINILEFGVRDGNFLMRLRECGFHNLFGLDCVKLSALFCKKRGLNVVHCDAAEAEQHFSPESFDLIIMYHMLEHTTRPLDIIKIVYNLLKRNGVLHIEIPIEYTPPNVRYAHCYNFLDKELQYFLREANFEIVSQSCVGGTERYTAKK